MDEKKRLFSNKLLAALIIPMMIELALKLVVGMIDSVMVSSAGEAAVSGVSLVDTVMQLVIYIFSAMAAGGAVVAGQYLGGKDKTSAKKAAGDVKYPMIMSIVSMWVFRFGGAYLLAYGFHLGAVGIWVAMSTGDSGRWYMPCGGAAAGGGP